MEERIRLLEQLQQEIWQAMNTARKEVRNDPGKQSSRALLLLRQDLKRYASSGVVFRTEVLGYVLQFRTLLVWADGYTIAEKDESNG